MSTIDFGGKLRQARERRGISLRQIAGSTKISPAALDALERNDVTKLPGGIFSRAFVRSYAAEVGLDPDETVKEFLERFQTETPPASSATHAATSEQETRFESQRRMATGIIKLVLIGIPIAGAILYFTLRYRAAQTQSPKTESSLPPAPSAPPVDAPAVAPAVSPGAGSLTPAAPPVSGSMTIEVHPTGPCRITLTVDGTKVLDRLMKPGEKEVRTAGSSVVIEVGDAGAFAFSIDGRPGKSLGETGQARTARITRDTMADYLR